MDQFASEVLSVAAHHMRLSGPQIRDRMAGSAPSCENWLNFLFRQGFDGSPFIAVRETPYADLGAANPDDDKTRCDIQVIEPVSGRRVLIEAKHAYWSTKTSYPADFAKDIRKLEGIPSRMGTRLFLLYLTAWDEDPMEWLDWARRWDPDPSVLWLEISRFTAAQLQFAMVAREITCSN